MEACCVRNPQAQVRAGDLYSAYRQWAEKNGVRAKSMTEFGKRISREFEKKVSNGVVYLGIGLRES